PRGAERQPSEHGGLRVQSGNTRIRGGGRSRLHHHRRLARNRAILRARTRDSRSRERSGGSRTAGAVDAGKGARDRCCRQGPRPRRPHLCAARRAAATGVGGYRKVSAVTPPPSEKLRIVILGLSITSSWGNGHATT